MSTTPASHGSNLGLTSAEVAKNRQKYGSNELTPPKKESLWKEFLEKFEDPIIIILLVAMFLSLGVSYYEYFIIGERSLALFLKPAGVLLAVLLATGVAFYFELQSEKEFEILNQVNEDILYEVYRDGQISQILKKELVVGDVVLLETDEEVPADGTLIECISLQVDESSLTGEPHIEKSTNPEEFDSKATYPANYICRGTSVLDGHCLFRIGKVGDATEYGRVYEGAQMDNSVKTPLNNQLDGLANLITKVSYAIAILILVGSAIIYAMQGGFSNADWAHTLSYFLQKVMIAVTVIVVTVPEGLPMSVTLSLAYSMRSMMKTNDLVRRMHTCETMGTTTVICTDKTGTLTQNRMTVTGTSFIKGIFPQLVHLSMAVDSTAHLDQHNSEHPSVLGNPTEGALLLQLHQQEVDYKELRQDYPLVSQLPFSTKRKYMTSVIQIDGVDHLLIKGAPEIVMQHCSLSTAIRSYYEDQLLSYQSRAMRTIGFAYAPLNGTAPFVDNKLSVDTLTFIGVVGISDPIRPEIPAAIQSCTDAGIRVKIVTGDTSGTAKEIEHQVGLWDDSCTGRNIIAGAEFAQMSDEELASRVQDVRIVSRARPMDKEHLVRLLQEQGEVVAVTGDRTNDAPALNRAHVGLSMGDGTSVAKEASDITILDSSFVSISKTVMWGRSLYLNIQRFILFQMTISVAACIIVLIDAFLDTESPLTVTQMLWVNLIMDTFAALALASLPPSTGVVKSKPRKQTDNIISPAMTKRIFGLGSFFVVLLFAVIQYFKHTEVTTLTEFNFTELGRHFFDFNQGAFSGYKLTVFFCFFVFLQFWDMFNAKTFHSGRSALADLKHCRNFLFIASVIVIGQVVITTFGGEMFRVVPLDLVSWAVIVLSTNLVLWCGEIFRRCKA